VFSVAHLGKRLEKLRGPKKQEEITVDQYCNKHWEIEKIVD
jgi:hypothetical protein